VSGALDLAGWRRTTAEMYSAIRATPAAVADVAWRDWRAARNALFKSHPASPLDADQRAAFRALAYYDYDPAWRLEGRVTGANAEEQRVVELGADGRLAFSRVATVTFDGPAGPGRLSLFWIAGYGGGLFLPFQDETNGGDTYGGGRYLYDTIKGADLGAGPERICLDFNFAYNPSCAYHHRWVCPLSPPENKLPFAVPAGERSFA
jgi:hypothetical protein